MWSQRRGEERERERGDGGTGGRLSFSVGRRKEIGLANLSCKSRDIDREDHHACMARSSIRSERKRFRDHRVRSFLASPSKTISSLFRLEITIIEIKIKIKSPSRS